MVHRSYAGDADREAMARLLAAARPPGRLAHFPSPHDLHEIVVQAPKRYQIELWEDRDGSLAAFAVVDLIYSNLYFEVMPTVHDRAVAAEIVDWAAECVRRSANSADDELALDTACLEDDAWRLAFLQRHGFVVQDVRTLAYARPLSEPIPAPQLPAGFMIRSVAGEREAEALAALHRAAFGTELMTTAERLAMMRVPGYEPALDLVAVAPGGELAATCFCSVNDEEGRRLGHTDPVSTHPRFQRLGLARALLLEGLRMLKERGAETALLGTSSENTAMQRAAESAGFAVAWSKVWLSRPLTQAPARTRRSSPTGS